MPIPEPGQLPPLPLRRSSLLASTRSFRLLLPLDVPFAFNAERGRASSAARMIRRTSSGVRPRGRSTLSPVLFSNADLEGLRAGTITRAYRRWTSPRAKAGGRQRTRVGVLAVTAVEAVRIADITSDDARAA